MLLPTRNKILAEVISRERVLSSGIVIPDRIKSEKKDNICRVLGVGDGVKVIRRTDWLHHKIGFGVKLTYDGRKLIVLKENEVIAVEREDVIVALGSTVICKVVYDDTIGTIIVPDKVKQNSGEYHGEVVSVGPDFMDKSLKKGDKIVYLRNEGYRLRSVEGREDFIAIQSKWIYGRFK